MKNGTVKVSCSCKHEFQDKQYGVGTRIANTTAKTPDTSRTEVRCTVCKKLHVVSNDKIR